MCNNKNKPLGQATVDELISEIMARCPGTANYQVSRAVSQNGDKTVLYPAYFHTPTFVVGDPTRETEHVEHKTV